MERSLIIGLLMFSAGLVFGHWGGVERERTRWIAWCFIMDKPCYFAYETAVFWDTRPYKERMEESIAIVEQERKRPRTVK